MWAVVLKTFLFRQWGNGAVWTVETAPTRNILTYLVTNSRHPSAFWSPHGHISRMKVATMTSFVLFQCHSYGCVCHDDYSTTPLSLIAVTAWPRGVGLSLCLATYSSCCALLKPSSSSARGLASFCAARGFYEHANDAIGTNLWSGAIASAVTEERARRDWRKSIIVCAPTTSVRRRTPLLAIPFPTNTYSGMYVMDENHTYKRQVKPNAQRQMQPNSTPLDRA